jgi:hypothetical protein
MNKKLDFFIDTVIGENGTELKQFDFSCSKCGNKSQLTVPVAKSAVIDSEYAKLLLKKQRDEIRRLKLVLAETTNVSQISDSVKPGKIYGVIKEALINRGMTTPESEVVIKSFLKEQL